ncbi:phosphatase 2C 47 [Gracilariopsis chorda]|uniref:Phosphatase 2C 47 n=1 Tax=Gracilariopsis chorda TaxID=448386 RepID=A0A2V3J263_9FLOR|nr:phosphatase 2C 47 [Gracilariopsis chorda]|eukprot:PXF48484.1 phosphatase 2C 47 [Gracilariopsis chorda]
MVAFATAATGPSSPSQPSATYATRTVIGSLHHECDIPNQDAHVSHSTPHATVHLVLDGHGPDGDAIATRAAHTLLRHLVERLHKLVPDPPPTRHHAALRAAFAATAELVDTQPAARKAGTTASAAVVERDVLTVANVGDSDVVLASSGLAKLVSFRHRPTNDAERQRVIKSGAVVSNGYVCDNNNPPDKMISITRAFGDLDIRAIGLVPIPEIATYPLSDGDFVILATDGLWDAHGGVSPQTAVDAVTACFEAGGDVSEAVDQLVQLAKGRCRLPIDDLTVTVVRQLPRNPETHATSST